jgi:hypothetical protein
MLHVATLGPQHQPGILEWEIVDLLLSDEGFVQEMFEDIVTAEWPPTPDAPRRNPPGARGSTAGVEKPGPPATSAGPLRQRRLHHPGTDGLARERSPPEIPQRHQTVPHGTTEVMPSRDATAPE